MSVTKKMEFHGRLRHFEFAGMGRGKKYIEKYLPSSILANISTLVRPIKLSISDIMTLG